MSTDFAYDVAPEGVHEAEPCPDCGRPTKISWGFVIAGDEAHGLYFARWAPGHPERGAQLLICLGDWGDGAEPEDRRSVGVVARTGAEGPELEVIDAGELPWAGDPRLGEVLSRERAREQGTATPALAVAAAVVDRLRREDADLGVLLEAGPG